MSDNAPLDTPGAGDNGKVQTYVEALDRWVLEHRVTAQELQDAIEEALTDIDLSAYSTTAQMNAAIAAALVSYATTTAMNNAITAALTNYVTTSALNTAIGNVVQGYDNFPHIPVGRYLHPKMNLNAGNTMGAGARSWHPIVVHRQQNFDRIAFRVSTGSPGAFIRVGIYDDNGGYPGDLIADGGSPVDCTTASQKDVTVNLSLAPGLYWLVGWCTGATATIYAGVHTGGNGIFSFHQGSLDPGTVWQTGYLESGLTVDGALPATAPAFTGAASGRWPLYCILRAA